ncbi:unnamed protein product [Caenorhabditis bovis]|uniref:CAP-Gly domain-containing protein n=1 Tax=Caenorhabditis bovis TaxID=2654633 RepID=A0A8S1E509_9PELO|nr:unnamed protein product [Caenorhabditis bovis]
MSEVYELEITTNATEMPLEKKFPAQLLLKELKRKLELVVGTEASSMKMELYDSDGVKKADLSDDGKSLKDLGVRDGMRIHAIDITGRNEDLKDESMVEKYEISDDAYNQRTDSVRAWKKKMQEETKTSNAGAEALKRNEEAAKGIKVGDRCEIRIKSQMARRGEVAFIGPTKFKEGIWVGVKYDEPVGKNDGSVAGERCGYCFEQ